MADSNIAQSVHQRLLNIRDRTGEPFNRLLSRYAVERLLCRLDTAGYMDKFVLKGAVLMTLWQDVPQRPTRDVDLLGCGTTDHNMLQEIFSKVCETEIPEDDGVEFDPASVDVADIMDNQEYHGLRVSLTGYLGRAKLFVQVDIGFGDATVPEPELLQYPSILGFPTPCLRAYHPATVIAEKLSASVQFGMTNSRMKDFYDMYIILNRLAIDNEELGKAIQATFRRRGISLTEKPPTVFTREFWADEGKNTQWRAFLRRSGLADTDLSLQEIVTYLKERFGRLIDI